MNNKNVSHHRQILLTDFEHIGIDFFLTDNVRESHFATFQLSALYIFRMIFKLKFYKSKLYIRCSKKVRPEFREIFLTPKG